MKKLLVGIFLGAILSSTALSQILPGTLVSVSTIRGNIDSLVTTTEMSRGPMPKDVVIDDSVSESMANSNVSNEQSDYLVIGGGIGSPAAFNLISGYYFDDLAVRVSGGSWRRGWYGIQGDLSFRLSKSSSLSEDISLVAGRFAATSTETNVNGNQKDVVRTQNYLGASLDVYYAGFFLQTGLGWGSGDFPNPQLILQTGYLLKIW